MGGLSLTQQPRAMNSLVYVWQPKPWRGRKKRKKDQKKTTKQKTLCESFLVSYSEVPETPPLSLPLSLFAIFLFYIFAIEAQAWMASMAEKRTTMG